ncbi:MAG: DUF374 domain-containing protein [Anaerolineales bacterium]|nr:DUF374 domain-containing protein [Anaerolineales bacterium]MCB9004763.1 DUF374 domain-containing protein [Ardenticatenaceae bacterium]
MTQLRYRLNGTFLYRIAEMTRKRGRTQVSGLQNLEAAKASGKPLIFSAWHGMTMMLVGKISEFFNTDNIVLLMPDDWRGESLEVFANKMGAHPFPMNLEETASVGTARQLVSLVREVKNGKHCYITPDGPDGPAYMIKPGIAYIAQKARALILPFGAYARNGYRLNRWDTYTIPYPFSRISIHVGKPIEIPKKVELTAVTDNLTNILHHVTAQARANYYELKT